MKLNKGFTLIDLLIVIAALAILAAIVVPIVIELQDGNGNGTANAALTDEVTITKVPCYWKVVQLDENTPLEDVASNCDTDYTNYPAYLDHFWKRATRDIVFFDGNTTVKVLTISVQWIKDTVVCETVREERQAKFYIE